MEGLLQTPGHLVGSDSDNKSLLFLASQSNLSFPALNADFLYRLGDHCILDVDAGNEELQTSVSHRGQFDEGENSVFRFADKGEPKWQKPRVHVCNRSLQEMEEEEETEKEDKRDDEDVISDLIEDPITIVAWLVDCARQKDLGKGNKLHAQIVENGLLEGNSYVVSALLNMYAKCGAMRRAQELFNKLLEHSLVLWNALISGYSQLGYHEEALSCFEQMQKEGICPDSVTFSCVLKACGCAQNIIVGIHIHCQALRHGLLETNIIVANAVINMYAKCGLLGNAHSVFDALPSRDLVSWNALINGCAQSRNAEQAFMFFECMKAQGFCPDIFTFVCILKACASAEDSVLGQKIHSELVTAGLDEESMMISSALVVTYANAGMLEEAQEVLEKLSVKDVVAWTGLIEGYVRQNLVEGAFSCFEQMKQEGILPDMVLFVCLLKACGSVGDVCKGQQLHVEIVMSAIQDGDVSIGTALINMYADCSMLIEAREVFDELSVHCAASWTALIAMYAQHDHGGEALNCFKQMQLEGFLPNVVTYACILKACGSQAALMNGQGMHAEVVKIGLLETDTAVAGALIDMYAKCGLLDDAEHVLHGLLERDVVSWSALVSGYAQYGQGEKALICFEKMKSEGCSPNAFTFASILKACGSINAPRQGQDIHVEVMKVGCLEMDMVVGAALVDMYCKCGMLDEAQEVFERLDAWDVFSWSALISGYAVVQSEEALSRLGQMELEGFSPNAVTFISILKACGGIGAAIKGQKLHTEIVKLGLIEESIFIGTALVDMYANCGMVTEAQAVFDSLAVQSLDTWNSLIAGYVLLGKSEAALKTYMNLLENGREPDAVTFTLVLALFSKTGAVEAGPSYFEMMSARFVIPPTLEHCTCMVDLFGRAGHLDYAVAVIREMPTLVAPSLWHSLLAACQRKGNVELGHWVLEQAVQMDWKDGASFVSMCNILYSS